MSKKRSNSDNILLPETVVTPHGGYTNFTGEETLLPSFEYFKKAEIDKDRVKAIGKMLSLESPVDPKNPNSSKPSMLLGKMGMSDDTRKFILGLDKDRRTCLYTVSSQYNDTPVASNKLFSAVPEQYGFIEVPSDEANIGDIAQFWKHGTTPSHATMITGHSPEGIPLISYSNGNIPAFTEMYGPNGEYHVKENLIKNREITDKPVQDLGTQHYYRYVGSPKKHEMIERRYEMLKNGERIFKEGGFLQPRDAWDALSMREKAEMIGVAVRNGITNLNDIREKYNEFAEGGSKEEVVNTDEQYLTTVEDTPIAPWQLDANEYKKGGSIRISPSKRGTFTAAAKKHGKSVQAFASQVLAHPENYSPAMRRKANFARNAAKWHGLGGNLFELGGITDDNDPATKDWEHRREHEEVHPMYQRTQKDEEYWREKQARNAQAAEELNRKKGVVMSALEDQANSTPFTGEGYKQAVDGQRQRALDKAKDFEKGARAVVTAAELGLSGASLLGAYANWKNWANAASLTKRGIANLLQKAQAPMQEAGALIDGYQTMDALGNNEFDTYYNGASGVLGVAGTIGASDIFRGRYPMVDRFLDTSGIIQNAGDFIKFGYDTMHNNTK